jgi:hypothetical protein
MTKSVEMMPRQKRVRFGSSFGLALGVAFAIPSSTPSHAEVLKDMVSIECDIQTRAVSGGTEFSGIVRSPERVSGDYSFAVASAGAGGTSSVIQRGSFHIDEEQEAMVGQILIGSGARTQVTARLSIRTEFGDQTCDIFR